MLLKKVSVVCSVHNIDFSSSSQRDVYLKRARFDDCLKELSMKRLYILEGSRKEGASLIRHGNNKGPAIDEWGNRFQKKSLCHSCKKSPNCPNCIDSKIYWTWPSRQKTYRSFGTFEVRKSTYGQSRQLSRIQTYPPFVPDQFSFTINRQRLRMKAHEERFYKRLVMEEQERREEAERWKERGDSPNEAATLPVKRSSLWGQSQSRVVTTTAILEGARNLSSGDVPRLNGLVSGGLQRDRIEQTDPDEKPPKLVVNLNQSDKASQWPDPLPAPEPELKSKKADQVDGNYEPESSCLVDCLYYTLQCCDCSIM